jgi:hypothetical protein
MMLKSDATRNRERLEHLAQVHALSRAIASAISAIEKNDLRQFETHLADQETICNRISALGSILVSTAVGENLGENADKNSDKNKNEDRQLRREIFEAHKALAQLNRVYTALLKRPSKTVAMILALHRSNGEGYHGALAPLQQRRSWSCEV